MTVLNVKEIYNDLHQMPEIGLQEFKTSAYLADAMEKLGYEVTRNVNVTGVVAIEKGEEPGPTLLLRADMDALPFVIDGKPVNIHACGHDAHSAMLLAAASVLKGKIKRGTLKVLF
ncbi:MAG: amidohydrolase, partial [Phascolarctobacterium sp.]|nr:amidohydrolase [Phascolarctobacterium sp.]